MENLIQRLEKFIDIEYDTKNAEVDELLKLSLEERVTKGEAIGGLTATFYPITFSGDITFGGSNSSQKTFSKVTVKCTDNFSKFRETTPVTLHGNGCRFECEVEEDRGNEMRLKIGYNFGSIPSHLIESSGWSLDNSKVDIRHIVKKSTSILRDSPSKHQQLARIFSGKEPPAFDNDEEIRARQLVEQTGLNNAQKEAFIKALAARNYYLVQGPPGTGKTHLLAHIAKALAEQGLNVLITAFTHTAINNALQKISSLTGYPHVVKVGKNNQKENLNYGGSTVKNVEDFSKSAYNNQSKGVIVGGTCYSVHTRKLEWMPFNVVIFDEAAQLNIPLAVAAMVKGSKYIFIGDHMQLPPIISEKQIDKELSCSVFELLYRHAPGTMLDVTYRMNEPINRFSSQQFYQGKLYPHSSCVNRKLSINGGFSKYQDVLDPQFSEVLVHHSHSNHTTRSDIEADAVAEMAIQFLSSGVPATEIAIITPYRAQVRLIKNFLSQKSQGIVIPEELFIDTVERMQGQEREVILFSLTTSDPAYALEKADFLLNPNRFNVALTRAKMKRVVVGSERIFNLQSSNPAFQKNIEVFNSFFQCAFKRPLEGVGVGLF